MISNVSFPKRFEEDIGAKGGDASLILPYILDSVRQLEKAGVDFIVMPCNTLHALMSQIRYSSKTKFIDLIEEVSREVRKNYKKIGILCTTKTKKEKLYDNL